MILRKATLNDLSFLVQYRIDFIQSVKKESITDTFRISVQNFLVEHLEWDDFLCYVAEENGEIVSMAMLSLYDLLPTFDNESGKCGYLFNVYTLPSHQRKGYATAIMKKIYEEATALGIEELRLKTTEAGSGLYKKLGFQYAESEMILSLK